MVGQQCKGYSCVCHDDYGAAYALTELMLKKGAKQPAYIGVTDEDKAAGEARHRGFLAALADNQLRLEERHSAVAEFHVDSGYRCAGTVLTGKQLPDCIFCATDSIAAGAIASYPQLNQL